MKYGENDGAVGYLIGEENRGLQVMFLMMNAARLAVGVQGVAIAERATQAAHRLRQRAQTRRNRRDTGRRDGRDRPPPGCPAHAVDHEGPDSRSHAPYAWQQRPRIDVSERAGDEGLRAKAAARAALLTPVAKAYSTDIGVEVASIGVQVHGGMGYVEETGAAQFLRDARIFPIYEGTNGIQAIDLVQRKLPLDGGETLKACLAELGAIIAETRSSNAPGFADMAEQLGVALDALATASDWMSRQLQSGDPHRALAGATAYLRLFGVTAGGTMLAKCALDAARAEAADQSSTATLARFFAAEIASAAPGLARATMDAGTLPAADIQQLLVA